MVPVVPEPSRHPWDEWARLTQFLQSARFVFARERELWAALGIKNAARVRVAAPDGSYSALVHKHVDTLEDAEILYESVLVHSYALAESAAAVRLETDQRCLGRIEEWGAALLRTTDRAWTDVEGDLAGAVEVAVARNAFAHGARTIDPATRKRLLDAGAPARAVGSVVTLSYAELGKFRSRLKSLLNAGGIGGR